MMHLNTHYQHTKDVLNRNLMRLGFVVFILLMVSSSFVSAQTNVEVCRDGVIRLEEQLKDPYYMGAGNDAPPGHLQKGYWSNTAGLTFSDINDPNAIISGFDFVAPGTTYTLTWFHADGQTYDITVQVSNNIAPQYDLHNEDGNTANVLFCTTPSNYDFTVVPSATNPAATISAIDYVVYHNDGSTPYERTGASNPERFNLNASTDYQDLDVYYALVSNGTCLDITTNTIQLSQISSVVVQIQGDLSSCDPNVFDGSHILEVLPFDPNNFDYQWQFNGANIAGATSSTYTLSSTPGEGSYTVTVTNKTDPTCGTTTEPVVVSVNPLPQVSIVDNPAGSGTFEICDGATNIPMNTSLSGGTVPAVFDYDWYQNGTLVSGNNSSYLLNNDDTDADGDDIIDDPNYNAFGDYYVVYKDADNIECKSYSTPVSIVSTVIDNVTMLKGNNATPFCGSGTPRVAVTVNGGSAPYTLTFSNGYSATLPSNGASINLPAITATTTFNLISVVDNSSGCSWTGNETQTFNVATAPLAYSMEDASGSINPTVNACMGSSVGLYLSDTELNVNYQVYDSSNTPIGGLVAGTGNPILLTTVNTAGVFNVVGTSTTNGCQTTMGSMTVNYVTPPTGSIRAGQAFEKCNGSAATFGVTIDITPTNQGPWDLVITDGSNDYNFTATTSTDTWTTPNVGTTRTFTIKSIEDRNGCTNTTTNTGSVTITINPTPTITLIGPDDVCIGDAPISITADITPVGTVINRYEWSTGIVDNGKQTITVSPNNIPTHTYSVEVETDKGCINTQSKDITVHPLPVVSFDSDGSKYVFCMDDTPASLTGSPLGGKFYVDGVELGANSFNPASYTQGDHNVEYFYQDGNGCESSFLRVFTVNAVPNVTLSGLQNQYCADAGGVTIQGSPDGSAYVPPIPGTFTSNPSHSSYFTDNGDGTADFDVASAISVQGPGNYIFTYTYTNNEGCDASATYTTTLLNDLGSTLSFSGLPANICQTASPVTLIPYNSGVQITPAPGTTISFTGPAGSITYDASNGTAEFDPAVAGAGNYTITLNYSDANGCTGSVSNTIQVGTPISIPGLGTEYCSSNSTPFTLTGQVNGAAPPAPDLTTFDIYAPDGTTTVALNQANGTYDFIPSTLFGNYGGGVYKVHYKYEDATGCINTLISNVTIIEELNAVFTIGGDPYATAQANYCDNDSPVDLEGHADLGTALGTVSSVFTGNGVSGNGVSGGFFNPQDASVQLYPNTNTITHTVFHTVNGLSCPSTPETFDVTVVPVQVNISGLSATKKYCTNDGTSVITVSGADASGGTATFTATKNGSASVFIDDNGDNTADIDPSVGAGIYVITMTFEKTADGCEKTITETVEVFADNPVTFSGVTDNQKICQSSDPITLRGDMFAGGVGNFIEISPGLLNTGTDDLGNAVIADDGKAVLTPGAMTLGPHTIIYEFTNANGCTTTESKDIEIVSAPTDTYIVTGGGAYCIDDSPKGMTIGLSGSNSGVTYELLFGGSSLTPKVEYVSTGGAFNFTVNSDGTGGDQLFDKEGVYTVKAVLGGCDAYMTGSVTIEQYELVLQQVSKDNISCNGLSDGTVTLLATGGSGSYEYAVDGGTWQASPTFTGLSLGDHDFSVKDLSSAACEAIDVLTINITQPSAISITEIENIPVGCAGCSVAGGTCEGSSTITISGGTPDLLTYPGVGYGVLWSNGQTGLTVTNLPTGTHSVTVTDGNGCTQNFGVVISTVTPTLSLDENIGDHIDNVCNNGADGQYIVTATGGTGTYEFTTTDPTDPTAVWVPGNVTADQYRVQGLEDGTYLVWVRDADPIVDYSRCYTQVTTPIIILEPAALSLVEDSKIGITCSGNTDGSFVVKASGGESADYEFSEVNPSVAVAADWKPESGIDTYELIGKGAGTYRVWVRDASYPGCGTSFVDVTLSPIDPFTFIVDEHKNVSCNSYNDGRLEVTAQGGSGNYVYQWEYPDASIVNSNLIDLLYAGDYNLTIIDNDPLSTCADLVQTFTITQPDVLTIQNENIFSADCENTGSIQLEVVGGTPPYNINWSDGTNQVLANPGIISVSGLAPGNYTIDITDANLCNYNNVGSEFVVSQNNPITLLVPATVINNSCNGGISGSIYVKVEGGSGDYQFRLEGPVIRDWSNSTSATMDDFTFAGLVEGNYDVKVRDANNTNCVYTVGSYTLVDPAPLGLVTNSISDVTCFGDNDGSFTVTASGGSGTYQFNVDNTGYNTGDNPALFTKDFLLAGDHTVWVRDSKATGCQYQLHPVITVDQVGVLGLSIDSYQDVSCHDGLDGEVVLVAAGGSGDYDFSKDGGATWDVATSNTLTYDKLFDGTYDFRVRDHNSLTCTPVSVIHDVEEPLEFTTSAIPTHVKCRGESTGQIVLTTTYSDLSAGAFTYSIDGGTTWQSTPITGLSSGTYIVDVKDNTTGCIKTNQVSIADATITEPSASITIGAELITNVTCYEGTDGEIDLQGNVSGGTVSADYKYTWYKKGTPNVIVSTGSDVASNLKAGTYFVVVEDDNGCSEISNEYIIIQASDWNVDYTASDLTKYNGADGVIDVHTHTGSNPVHSIEWFTVVGGVEATLSPLYDNVWTVNTLQAGTYRFKISDGLGCIYVSDDIVIAQPDEFIVTTSKTDVTCYGYNNGIINISIPSGSSDYHVNVVGTLVSGNPDYTLDIDINTDTRILNSLEAGSYSITVTDNVTSEIYTTTVLIIQPNELTITATPTDVTCEGNADGILSVDLSGHIDGATISWTADNGYAVGPENILAATTTYSKSGLDAGSYIVTVTNNNGCPAVQETNIVISEPAAWSVTTSVTNVTSYGHNDGAVAVDYPPTGNIAPYTIGWDDDVTVTAWSRSGLTAGNYIYTITDATSNCTYSETLTITQPNQLLFDLIPTNATCYGYNNGSIGVDITSGNPNYQIVLTGTEYDGTIFTTITVNGNTTGNHIFSDLKAGSYQVAITDAKGENLTKSVTVGQLAEFAVSLVDSEDITCNDGADGRIEIEITGRAINESTSTINWTRTSPAGWSVSGAVNDGTTDLKELTGLEAGTYTINVSDQFGCDATTLVEVLSEPAVITASHTVTHVSTAGGTDGRILITNIVSENNVQSIVWNKKNAAGTYVAYEKPVGTQVTGYDNNNIEAGVYQYIITDDNGCTYTSEDIYVTEPGALVVNVTDTDINCYGGNNGIISVNITSGTAPYSVVLSGIPDDGSGFAAQTLAITNSVFTNLKPGTYKIDVVDGASQTYSLSDIIITQNAETILSETLSDITCFGQGDGSITMNLNGNVNSGVDSWQVIDPNGATVYNGILNGYSVQPAIISGDYNVIVTNQDGCSITETYSITEPNAWNVHHNVVDVTPTGNTNGEINIDVLSGNTPDGTLPENYTITWTGPAGAPLVNNQRLQTGLPAGTYSYHIVDAVGCTYDSGDIIISEPSALTANVTASDVDILCYGDDEGEILVTVLTGNEPYTINITGNQYDGNAYTDTYTLNTNTGSYTWDNLLAGEYEIAITDGVGNTFTQTSIMLTQPDENLITEGVSHLTCHAADQGAGEVSVQLNRNFLATDKVVWTGPSGIIDNGPLPVGSDIDLVIIYEGGDYSYTFTDGNGCPISGTITVDEPTPFTIDYDASDATIFGNNDGIIDVHTVFGNNGVPYTISWADDATVTDFLRNDLVAGTYSFTIVDTPNGCDTTIMNIVIGQPEELIVNVTPQDAICYGYANGEIQVEFTSHNGGLSYRIIGNTDDGNPYDSGLKDPVLATSVINGLKAGTYEIDAYDSKGTHYHEENIRVEQESIVTITGTPKDITCFGDGDGRIVVALNGRAPLSTDVISWSGSNGYYLSGPLYDDVAGTYINNQIDPVLVPEIFNVTVTSAQGCTYNGEFEVKQPNEIVITVDDVEDVTCVKGTDGSIDISVTGRAGGGYTYVWEKKDVSGVYQPYAGNSASLAGLSAGEYQVTVKSITDNCEATYSDIEVLDGSEITINETLTHIASCVGDNSGVITVSVEDGFAPFKVNVTGQPMQTGDGSTAFVFDELYAGNYVIEVSDARGVSCATVTKNVTITEPAVAFDVTNPVHNIDCDPVNSTSGTFTFNITGGVPVGGNYRYQILLPEASIAKPVTNGVGSTYTENINGLDAGTYNLTVLDLNSTDPATCAFKYQFTLEHIVITNDPVVHTTCKGINNGAITGISIDGASANYTYDWSTTDGGIGIDNTTLNQSGLSPGTYVLTITDPDRAGCSVSKTYTVGVDNTIVVNPTIKDVSCNGGTDGAVSIDVSGISPITSYTWTGPGIVDGAQKDQVNLPSGNYAVEITTTIDGQTCVANRVYTVAQPNPISYTAKYNYTDCEPFVRTLVLEDVKGGTGNYTYLWDGPAFDPVVPVDPKDVEIREGGIYSITVKDENQCELTKTLSVPYEISIDPVINDVTCNGGNTGSIVLNVAGGTGQYTFSWTGPDGYTSTDRNIDELYAGEYTVVITDQNENDGTANCFREFTLIVEEPSPIEIVSTVENTSCFGASDGLIEIEVSGGTAPYTYNWSPVVGANLATNRNQYNLPADTYTITVTDAAGKGGCIATKNIEVKQDAQIILSTVVTDTQCDGTAGAIDLTAIGGSGAGFAYDWSTADGSGLVQGDQDQSGLSGGTFTVVVSDLGDGRSCKATISETLTHEIEVINEVVSPVSCSGNDDGSISYDVTGGDGNYIYTWNVISGDATRIVAGSRNQSGLSEGEYEVTITDGRTVGVTDCAITHTFIVTATTGLSVNVAVEDSKMCFGESGGKLTAAVTGGSGDYKYIWNGVEGTNVLDNLVQGIYGLEVIDNVLGCNYIQSYEIKGPNAPLTIDNIVITDVLCYNENTGAIQVTVSGGTELASGGYIYTWTGGAGAATGSNPGNLFAGTYNLTVTDDNGCTVESGPIVVTQPTSYIKVDNPQITDVTVTGGTNGQILVDVYDGVAPRSVEWFDASNVSLGTLNPVTGLSAGTYRVVATDANGCPAELTGLRVVEPGEALGFEKTVHQISPCNGADNGEIHINRIYGGYPIDGDHYIIQITGPGTTVNTTGTSYDLTGLAPGTYIVTVRDDVDVTYQESIIIIENPSLSLNTNKVSDVDCFGGSNGSIQVEVSGGQADVSNHYLVEITSAEGYYNYKDDVVANTVFAFSNLPAGNYTVRLIDHAEDFDTKVPDRGNCELSEFTLITEPSALVELTAVGGDNEMCRGESVDLSLSVSNWDFTTQGNLRVAVYDNFTTKEYVVDESPYIITEAPASSRTYKVTNVVDPSNATCAQGESTGSQVQVLVHELPTANITGPTEVCEDGTITLNVAFTGSQPFSFTWQDVNNGTSNTVTGITSNSYTFTDEPIADASYIILDVSDDHTCTNVGNGQVDVTINNKPVVTLSGSTDICFGVTTPLTIGFNENKAPYTITYEANGVEGTLVVTPDASFNYTWNVSPNVTTTYEITTVIDSKGCVMDMVVPVQATVIVDQLPDLLDEITSSSDNGEVCQGISGIDYSVAIVDYATNYVWSVDAGMNITSGNGTNNITIDFDRDFAGGYIRVYAENDCGVSPVIERWVNSKVLPDPILSAPTGPTQLCQSATGVIYSINPVDNATSYEWSLPTGLILRGDGSGTSIIVDLDPDVPTTVGDILVRPVNDCSNTEPWSPALTVTINPLPTSYAGPDDRICQTTYTLNADPLNAGETGLWTIGGGSVQFNNKAVDQIRPNAQIYNLSQGDNTFTWTVTNQYGCSVSDEVVISNDQVTVNVSVSDTEVCDGTVTLFGTPVNAVSNADEGVWTTTGSGFIVESTNDETVVNDLDQGTNIFTWTIRKGSCYSSATVEVTNNKPTQPIVYNASDVAIDLQDLSCQTDFTTLRGTTPNATETGYWRIESGALSIDNMNSPTINITNIAKGDHVLSWNILRGDCLLKALVTIRNNSLNVNAGNDRYSCDGTTMLNGTEIPSDAVGQWTIIEGEGYFVEGGDKASTQVTGLDQSTPGGRNVFRWTLTRNGCDSYDEVIVYNDQPSAAEIAGGSSSISICDYEYTLHAVSPQYGTGVWSVVGGQGKFDNPADPNTRVYDLANGDNVFRWTVSNNTCSRFVDFTVTNLHIDAFAGADTAVCGRTAKLNATPVPDGATGQWTLVSGSAGVIFNPANTQADAFATSLGHGTNALVWTVTKDGCVSRDTVIVSNNAPFEVDASTYIYTDGNKTTLRAEIPEIGSGVWSLVEGRGEITNPTSATTEVTNLLPNYNYFRWTVTNANCVEYIDVAVQSGVLADADAGLDQMHLCEDYTTLNANEPEGTYGEWTIVEGSADFESYNNAKTRITNIRSGQNVFRWTLRFAGGSENFTTDTVIIVNNKPTDADAGLDIFECGDVATLNAREPVVGAPSWAVLSGGGVFTDNTDPKTIVTDLAKGENVFKYQIQEDICFSYDTISVFNFEPSDAYAGEDQVVCQDSAVLNPEIPKYGEGTWKIIEGAGKGKDGNGNEIDQIQGGYVYSLAPGVNKLVWEVKVPEAASSCVKRDTITIINNQPSVSFAGHDRSICTDTVSLSGSVPVYGEGTWTLLSGSGEIADSSQTNTLVTGLGVGKNRFRWTIDNNGCTSYSDVEIANNLIEAFAGYDQVNCVDTASLEGNNPLPGVGTWGIVGGSGSANFEDNESPYTEVRNLDKGENILTWTIDYKGCRSVSEVKITNNEPSQAIAGDNKATCENSIVLGAANPEVGTGSWTIRSGGGDFVDANNNSTQVNNLKFGSNVFRWTVENNGCQLYDDVEISFNRIDAVVGGTQEICADRTFLDANNASPGVGTWSVVGGSSQARFVDTHDATTEVLDLAKGNNILRWTINNEGCVTSAEVSVVNHTPSTAYAGNTQEICESTTVLDATAVSIGTGSWEVLIGAGTITSDQVNNPKADISGLSKGENVLRWTVTSDNGLCTSIDDVTVINNEPSEPYAGADEEYCSPTVVLKAAVPDFGTGNWSIIEGGGNFDDSTLPNATINNLNEGVNVLRWTISQGQCTKYSDIEVLNNTPTTANAGPDIEDCKDFAELDANLPTQGEGFWTLISGNADFIDETDAKTRVEGLTFGENILMWNVQKGGCISSDQITVFNQVPDQAQAGTDRTTCEDYLTLNANDPNTGIGTWTVISGNGEFDDVNSPTTIVRELGLGENRFKWTVAYGDCNTEDVVEVVSNKAAPYAGEDAVVYDSEFELKASNPGDLGATWSIVAGTGDFDDNTYFNTTVRNLSEGVNTFRWLMDVNGCITYDDVSVEYRVVPDAAFVVDTTQGCYPLSIQFTNYSDGGTSFIWDFGDGYSSTDRNPVHTFDDPGVYTVTLTAPGPDGVNGIYTMDINVFDHPVAEFSYNREVVYVPGNPLSCSSLSTGAVSYLWDFGDGNTSTEVNPFHKYTTSGTFDISLEVVSQYGCTDQIVKTNAVTAKLEGFITFPTAFTPRPDGGTAITIGGGANPEVFSPVSRDVDQYKLQIFNRWGQLIYESTDIEEGWNGFYNNALSPQGVYVWKATGTFVSGKEFTEAGSVLLVR